MDKKDYDWKRFWVKREGRMSLSDHGYLVDPDSEWGEFENPDVLSFESIASTPCLVLLGEPGIGKSTTIKSEYGRLHASEQREKMIIDLRSIGSEERLHRKLFGHPTFVGWREGSHSLNLFLDSLDECLLRIDTLANLLIDEFRDLPISRLSLRIACRTADWPGILEKGLAELWGKVAVFEMAPLRRSDVMMAAQANGLDPARFQREIDRVEAVPLAIKPVTLEFLLNTFARSGELPKSQTELYRQGCLILCEEQSESRRGARIYGSFSPEQRLALASRIAAVTIFSNKYAVWTGASLETAPPEDIALSALAGETEFASGTPFGVSEDAVREAIATGLFSSRGPERLGWAHQTYAEFLAARYLVDKDLASHQVMTLIVHPSDQGRKLVPQLHETAAWLASMDQRIFDEVMKTNPEVLMQSDAAASDDQTKSNLVAALLGLIEREEILNFPVQHRWRWSKLKHPHLGKQLEPFVIGQDKGIFVRRTAIDLAEGCEVKELQKELARIALDTSESIPIRVEAAHAVYRIGDRETKAKLIPLIRGQGMEDPEDRLKGVSLYAVWPDVLTAQELFATLTPPKAESFIGHYQLFLSGEVAKHLQPVDIPFALKWITESERKKLDSDFFEKAKDAIMLKAWEYLDDPDVLDAFAEAVLFRLRAYDSVVRGDSDSSFKTALANEHQKRRTALRSLLPLLSPSDRLISHLAYLDTPFARDQDLPWMIECLRDEESPGMQTKWAQIIRAVFNWSDARQVDAILDLTKESKVVAEAFKDLVEPVDLDSSKAQETRKQYWMIHGRDRKRKLLDPPPAERISSLLDSFESGNLAAWWQVNMEMTLEPNSAHYNHEYESDLTVLPGWKIADEATRMRITRAALRYVFEADPEPEKWLGKNVLDRPSYSGVRALRLLMMQDPSSIESMPDGLWSKWAIPIVGAPWPGHADEDEKLKSLVKRAYAYAPQEIISTLMVLVDKEDREHGQLFCLDRVGLCWDERLASAVFEKAKDTKLKAKSIGNLFDELVRNRFRESYGCICSLMNQYTAEGKRSDLAFFAAEALLEDAKANWTCIWNVIQEDEEFGRRVLESAFYGGRQNGTILKPLPENEVAELFVWLSQKYPHENDPKHDGPHEVGKRESVGNWRDDVLRHLKQRGTVEACNAIEWIREKLPHLEWLKWTLVEARALTRERTWVPPEPESVLAVTRGTEFRLVQDGQQLLDVIMDSLSKLQSKMHGETPSVVFLWDEIGKGEFKPKDEGRLSDFVKIHLDEDLGRRGIIVNREVEVRRIKGQGTGERTDIHVDAVKKNVNGEIYDRITVVIEAKGCWNRGLDTAMEIQLIGQYLPEGRCQHGLYLVGWFNCDIWTEDDYRKKQAPSISIGEARSRLEGQARDLSIGGKVIKSFVLNCTLQ